MKTFIACDDSVTVPAPTGGVTPGQFVEIGALRGFAVGAAAGGELVAIMRRGRFLVEKPTNAALAIGVQVEQAAGIFSAVDAGAAVGITVSAAAETAETVEIILI